MNEDYPRKETAHFGKFREEKKNPKP